MVEAPAALHAPDGVGGAGDCGKGGKDDERSSAAAWEVGEVDGGGEAGEDKEIAA